MAVVVVVVVVVVCGGGGRCRFYKICIDLVVVSLRELIHRIHKAWSEHGVEVFWDRTKNILLFCPKHLDSMLAPGFMNSVYSNIK